MVEAVEFEINKMKRTLNRNSEQKHLSEKDPVSLLQEVFACAIPLCPSNFHSRVAMFFDIVTRNKLLRKLFQLAIYEGAYGMKSKAKKEEEYSQGMQAMFSTGQGAQTMNYKSPGKWNAFFWQEHLLLVCYVENLLLVWKGEILHSLLPCLKCLPFPVDLAILARTEMELMDTFGVENFFSLGQGPFLSFIAKQPRAIEALGGRIIGAATNSVHSRAKRMRAMFFVKQLKDTSDKVRIELRVMCSTCMSTDTII